MPIMLLMGYTAADAVVTLGLADLARVVRDLDRLCDETGERFAARYLLVLASGGAGARAERDASLRPVRAPGGYAPGGYAPCSHSHAECRCPCRHVAHRRDSYLELVGVPPRDVNRETAWTVLVCTRDRAGLLAETLRTLARLDDPGVPYEVVVVDNGSRDRTPAVVRAAAASSRVPLRYVYEARGGLSVARNTGVAAARGDWIAFTDDDVAVEAGWLAALERGARARPADFLGGPVLPRWGAPPPRWLPAGAPRGEFWGALALLDYGTARAPLAIPLGANMAVRRAALRAVGPFREDLGRDAGSLKSQAVPELMLRLKAAGARGWYLPDARVSHWIPPDRLTKRYVRRWFFWKGISRATMERHMPVDEGGIDLRTVPRIARVPRYMFRQAVESGVDCLAKALQGDQAGVLAAETRLCYVAGYARAVWFGDPSPTAKAARPARPASA